MERKTSDTERDTTSRKDTQRDEAQESGAAKSTSGPVASLQRTVGNQAVQRLYETGVLQPSLAVSQPTDEAEREAEQVADHVMRMSAGSASRSGPVDEIRQASLDGEAATGENAAERRLDSLTSGGEPLPPSVRSFFEPRFGRDFRDVRVHTGSEADDATRAIDAEAFTHGTDIVFRSGKYEPRSQQGKKLLAHELTHVTQQAGPVEDTTLYRQKSGAARGRQPNTGASIASLKKRLKDAGRTAMKKILKALAARVAPGAVAMYEVSSTIVDAIGEGTVTGIEKARANIQQKMSESMSGFVEGVKGTGEKTPKEARQDMRKVTGIGPKRTYLALGELETVASETWASVKDAVVDMLITKLKELVTGKILEALNLKAAVDALKPFWEVAVKLIPKIEGHPILGQLPGWGTKSENVNAVIRNALWKAYQAVKGDVQWPQSGGGSTGGWSLW